MNPPHAGQIGRYVIVDRLGHGGMGVVYRAWDPELRRVVALKMLPGSSESPFLGDLLERFAREARSAASLAHPNIVTIHDFGQDLGRPFIIMELVDGESMSELIRKDAPLSLARRLRLSIELCEGLAFAHSRGIIHRDIKPANLMITTDGVLKILDFGLARLARDLTRVDLTQAGAVLGTLLYMSPEQLSGQAADQRSDIFSVGAVLYELFTSRSAFDADNPALVRLQILHDTPRSMRELQPELPAEVETIVGKAMEKEPSRRYQNLYDLAADLRAVGSEWAGNGERIADTPPTPESAGGEAPTSDLGDLMKGWGAMVGDALATSAAADGAAASNRSGAPPVAPASGVPVSSPAGRTKQTVQSNSRARSGGRQSRLLEVLAVVVAVGAIALYLLFGRDNRAPEPDLIVPASSVGSPLSPATAPASSAPAGREPERSAPPLATTPAPPVVRAGRPASTRGTESAARCAQILERVGLGDELTPDDRVFLAENCRSGGK